MPFIEVKTTEDLSAVAAELKSALGNAITAIPGKSESWLMANLVGEQKMYFQGSDAPCALFSVSIFGTATDDAYDDLACRLPAYEAAACAVYLHGAAADRAAAVHGEYGMLPHDILPELGRMFAEHQR